MALLPVHLPILMYHQIMPESDPHFKKHIAVDPAVLRQQIRALQNEGWKFVTLEEYFVASARGPKVAVITFDDITANFTRYAAPVLEELGVRANVFPIQNMTTGKAFHNLKPEGVEALTEAELLELHRKGHALGSHCQSHQNLRKISFSDARQELAESKAWLEGITGERIQTICYPIGGVDRDIVEAARSLGYTIGVSTLKGTLQFLEADRMTLRRVNIKNDTRGSQLLKSVGPFYGFRRLLTRPFRAKYRVSERHPSFKKN